MLLFTIQTTRLTAVSRVVRIINNNIITFQRNGFNPQTRQMVVLIKYVSKRWTKPSMHRNLRKLNAARDMNKKKEPMRSYMHMQTRRLHADLYGHLRTRKRSKTRMWSKIRSKPWEIKIRSKPWEIIHRLVTKSDVVENPLESNYVIIYDLNHSANHG